MKPRRQIGQTIVMFAVIILTLLGLAALVIDEARLLYVARETQAVADASALGGVKALTRGGDPVVGAQTVAALNSANNQSATLDANDVAVGRYLNGTFTAGGTPYNAVRTIPHYTVNNIVGLWSSTSVTRRKATAAFQTLGQAQSGLPIALGSCFTCDPTSCSAQPVRLTFSTSTWNRGNNAAWIVYGGNNSASGILQYIPSACGGGGSANPQKSAGDSLQLNNGVITALCNGFSGCIGQNYRVPVIQAACDTPLSGSSPVIGFASMQILAANCNPPGYCSVTTGHICSNNNDCPSGEQCVTKFITIQPVFIDCNLPENAAVCPGGNSANCHGGNVGGSCPGCGTGCTLLVE